MLHSRPTLIAALLLSLAGCGGGSSGTDAPAASPAATTPASTTPAATMPVVTTPVATTPANTAPVANAGAAQSVLAGAAVSLDASASNDADSNQLTYLWRVVSAPTGSRAALSSPAAPKPAFTADLAGEYVFALVVNDGQASSSSATVTVTAAAVNAAPMATLGTGQDVLTDALVTLDGSGSSDANGDALTFAWTLQRPAGSTAVLSSTTSVKPTFTPDVPGLYLGILIVSDGKATSAPATTVIRATATNARPVANAGAASRALSGATVALNGAGSTDANRDVLTYAWTLVSRPAGSLVALAGDTSVNPTVTADLEGVYVFSLTVNDGKLSSLPVNTTVTVVPRITGVLGISTTEDYQDFCGLSGSFRVPVGSGFGLWTVDNCRVTGTFPANLMVRIGNNGASAYIVTGVSLQAAGVVTNYVFGGTGLSVAAGGTDGFAITPPATMEVNDVIVTLKIAGEPDLVLKLQGNMRLP